MTQATPTHRVGPILAVIAFVAAGVLLLIPTVPLWLRLGLVGLAAGALLGQARRARVVSGWEVDGEGVRELRAGQVVGRVAWAELVAVSIVRVTTGPWAPDFIWVLHDPRGAQLLVPLDRAAETSLLLRLGRLPGFDHRAVLQVTGASEDGERVCWQGEAGDAIVAAGELD